MIRSILQFATAVMIVAPLVAMPGCGGAKAPAPKPPAKTGHYEGDGHDHSKDHKGHDHKDHDHDKEAKPDKK